MPKVAVDLLSFTGTKGGMEVYTKAIYRQFGISPREFDFVGIASREGHDEIKKWFPGEVINSGITGEGRISWAIGELFRIGTIAEKLGADLLHCPATLGPRKTRIPTVITMHDMFYFTHPELMSTPLYTKPVQWMEKQAAANATNIITDSHYSARDILKYLPVDEPKVHVVHLAGLDPLASADKGARSTPGNEVSLPHPKLILASGARRPHKMWEVLVRALPLIEESERPHLVITGGRGDDPIQPHVDETGMHNWVELRGWVDDDEMRSLRRSATAIAVPSVVEGFSLPVVEAMAEGIPVVISDIDVHREIAGDAVLYFDPLNISSVAEALRSVCNNDELRLDLRRKGLDQSAKFSWENTASKTLDIFEMSIR